MIHETNRPPPIIVEDNNIISIRSDLKSQDVRETYPDLPISISWSDHSDLVRKRDEYLMQQDARAYETIRNRFPNFKPRRVTALQDASLKRRRFFSKFNLKHWNLFAKIEK